MLCTSSSFGTLSRFKSGVSVLLGCQGKTTSAESIEATRSRDLFKHYTAKLKKYLFHSTHTHTSNRSVVPLTSRVILANRMRVTSTQEKLRSLSQVPSGSCTRLENQIPGHWWCQVLSDWLGRLWARTRRDNHLSAIEGERKRDKRD